MLRDRFNRDFGQSVTFELRRAPFSPSVHSNVEGRCVFLYREPRQPVVVVMALETMKGKEKTIFFSSIRSILERGKEKDGTFLRTCDSREGNRAGRERILSFFLPFFSFFLSFLFRREISSASWNIDKSVKVSLNLKSVSNQIRRCNNIQGEGRRREWQFPRRDGYKEEQYLDAGPSSRPTFLRPFVHCRCRGS